LGLHNNATGRTQTAMTPLTVFNCPTRRSAILVRCVNEADMFNFNQAPSLIGRSDYAGCAGDGTDWTVWGIPPLAPPPLSIYATGDSWSWADWHVYGDNTTTCGVICRRSMCKIVDIPDGTSNTYLAGEKSLDPDYYFNGMDGGDDQGWDLGYDFDVNRWTTVESTGFFHPRPDQPGGDYYCSFGSAHLNGFQMAFCDGSVQMINYSIDPETHRRLGNRHDGLTIDAKAF
jgi:prepilin-type processing-associated H-X9-DG protein